MLTLVDALVTALGRLSGGGRVPREPLSPLYLIDDLSLSALASDETN